MIQEFNESHWIPEQGVFALEIDIAKQPEKPMVQVYRYLLPNNVEGAAIVPEIGITVVTLDGTTKIILNYTKPLRGYFVLKYKKATY